MATQSYHEVMDGNMRSMPKLKRAPAKLDHIRIEPAEGGGHIVEHHMHSGSGPYLEPEKHVFGSGDGEKLVSHIRQHLNIGTKGEKDQEKLAGGGEKEPTGDPNPGEAVPAKK